MNSVSRDVPGTVGTMVVVSTTLQSGSQYESLDGGSNANLAPLKVEYDEKSGVVSTYFMVGHNFFLSVV